MSALLLDRFVYHPPKSKERVADHEIARSAVISLVLRLDSLLPEGRDKDIAMQKLEETLMWSNAAIARAPQKE